jgi:hypothetical protein
MSRRSRRRAGRHAAAAPASFWGSPDVASGVPSSIHPTDEPTAVVDSLGPPPLAGHEAAASVYFAAVYAKAVGAASALAAAAGLLSSEPIDGDLDHEPGPAGHLAGD